MISLLCTIKPTISSEVVEKIDPDSSPCSYDFPMFLWVSLWFSYGFSHKKVIPASVKGMSPKSSSVLKSKLSCCDSTPRPAECREYFMKISMVLFHNPPFKGCFPKDFMEFPPLFGIVWFHNPPFQGCFWLGSKKTETEDSRNPMMRVFSWTP